MNGPRIVARPVEAASLAAALAVLARCLDFDEPTRFDRACRRLARTREGRALASIMAPLYPAGLPGGYISLATAIAYWLHRHRRSGGTRILASAWAGWLVHRAVKLGYRRMRPPRPGERARFDSFPSGHTTGATAFALTTAAVLCRERVLSSEQALAGAALASLTMGAYRVIADDHWATDVIGGWLLGGAVAACCAPRVRSTAASRRASRRRSRREARTFAA